MEKEIWILKLIGEITGPGFSGEIVLVFNNPATRASSSEVVVGHKKGIIVMSRH